MNSLDDFWRAMFGEGISNFEEMLMMRGACVMTPEEPLYSVFVMMVRVLHQSQGEAEKALLRFAPELTERAEAMIRASDGLERQLAILQRRAEEMSSLLRVLEAKSVGISLTGGWQHSTLMMWLQQNVGPVATSALVFAFCTGFIIASYVYAS